MPMHTFGPWHIGESKGGRRYIYARNNEYPLKPEVKLNKSGVTKEMEANIHLMAASPEMFELLDSFYDAATDGRDIPTWMLPYVDGMRKIIAKAVKP